MRLAKTRVLKLIHREIHKWHQFVHKGDKEIVAHCNNVSRVTDLLAKELKLGDNLRKEITYAAKIHDVGKIRISKRILNKPSSLDADEFEIIKTHAHLGGEMIQRKPYMRRIGHIVTHHHEWYNGNGYPYGLKGEDIPIGSRIIAVADAYDVMVNTRVYSEKKSKEEIIAELKKYSTIQFDQDIVDVMIKLIESDAIVF